MSVLTERTSGAVGAAVSTSTAPDVRTALTLPAWSVAVWVGFIALYGVAVQTGVVMVLYLHEALDKRIHAGNVTAQDVFDATVEGALLRVRPKLMTVATTVIGLLPLLWATGTGSDYMKPIAVPLIGGMVTSTVHVLLVTPVIFLMIGQISGVMYFSLGLVLLVGSAIWLLDAILLWFANKSFRRGELMTKF